MAKAKTTPPRVTLTNGQILGALRELYAPPEYALLEQVRSRTGFGGEIRTADVLAMNTFPGRGCEIDGFEIKVSRSDWMREKTQPQKAEEIQRHCDRWWLVVGDENIVHAGELPPTWGLIAPDPKDVGKLRVATPAPRLTTIAPIAERPLPRTFVAAILRNVAQAKQGMVMRDEIEDLLRRAREEGREHGERQAAGGHALDQARRDLRELKKRVDTFEAASGVKIESWQTEEIGKAVKMVLACGLEGALRGIEHFHEYLTRDAKAFGKRIAKVRDDLAQEGRVSDETLEDLIVLGEARERRAPSRARRAPASPPTAAVLEVPSVDDIVVYNEPAAPILPAEIQPASDDGNGDCEALVVPPPQPAGLDLGCEASTEEPTTGTEPAPATSPTATSSPRTTRARHRSRPWRAAW